MSVELRTAKRIISPCQVSYQKRRFKGLPAKQFIPFPARIDFRRIPASYLKVYLAISSQIDRHDNGNSTLFMRADSWVSRIQRISGLSRRQVQKAIRFWVEQGEIGFSGNGRTAITIEVDYRRFIKFPKHLIALLPKLEGSHLRLVLAIQKCVIKKTGWTYPVSVSQLMRFSGIRSRPKIYKAIKFLGFNSRPVGLRVSASYREQGASYREHFSPYSKIYTTDISRSYILKNKQLEAAINPSFSERKQNFKVNPSDKNWQSEINRIIKQLSASLSAER